MEETSDRYKMIEEFDKGKIEIVRRLKQKGMAVEDIIEITGLSREEIERVIP
jgi:predicted transposase YdaD